jgi:penicillin-binding protein 2
MSIFSRRTKYKDIDPDEIFLDQANLPQFNIHQFEGRIEKPISRSAFRIVYLILCCVGIVFMYTIWNIQVTKGQEYAKKSENNRLNSKVLFAHRGVIYDRNKQLLAWNVSSSTSDFALRRYATSTGISSLLGYISYPAKDNAGFYYNIEYTPKAGLEKQYNDELAGKNGLLFTETDALGNETGGAIVEQPVSGKDLYVSIDLALQRKLYESMLDISGRAGVIMDVQTGEILAMVSLPEYDSNVLTEGDDKAIIQSYLTNKNNPFLNRVIGGLYTPGSIVKPFVGMGVLDQGVISPTKQILSTGSLSIPNPYNPDKPTIFRDWKAHGLVDFRRALAVSSNVYFYEVGGGFKDQKGIGITNIKKYMSLFGLAQKTQIELAGEQAGVLPDPEWKKKVFGGEDWRVGDTYNTAIGQYGVQITPIQIVRGIGAIANGGDLLLPTLFSHVESKKSMYTNIDLPQQYFQIVREGMRMAVTDGTAHALNVPYVKVAAKTGTAELGISKSTVNSWVVGFFPYDKPKYAFAVVMEKGKANNQIGAALVMRGVFDWMNTYAQSYFD